VKAFLFCISVITLWLIITSKQAEFSAIELLFLFVLYAFISLYGLICIYLVIGETYKLNSPQKHEIFFSVWSYIWRLLIVLITSLLVVAGVQFIAEVNFEGFHWMGITLFFSLQLILVLVVITWGMFSPDRWGQLRSVITKVYRHR